MRLLAVNVSQVRAVPHDGKSVTTGIFKEPVDGRVQLTRLNLAGDQQADLKNHGGPYRAVYAYTAENYDYWREELGRDDFGPLLPGQFGENFTVEGMLEDRVHVGDVFRVGTARVQVTQPRVPCHKLALKMGDPKFTKAFLASLRVGFYLRVLEEGQVGAGDEIELVESDPERMSVRDICHLYFFDESNLENCQRALRIEALSPGWKEGLEKRLPRGG